MYSAIARSVLAIGLLAGGLVRGEGLAPGVKAIVLPGAPSPAGMDYLAYDPARDRVWVPAGNTGTVEGRIRAVEGFRTEKRHVQRQVHGAERTVGPSSAAVGPDAVYVGNRADATVCAVDAVTLARRGCATLPGAPDGLAYVAPASEVWATVPSKSAIVALDPASLRVEATLSLDGKPEG